MLALTKSDVDFLLFGIAVICFFSIIAIIISYGIERAIPLGKKIEKASLQWVKSIKRPKVISMPLPSSLDGISSANAVKALSEPPIEDKKQTVLFIMRSDGSIHWNRRP